MNLKIEIIKKTDRLVGSLLINIINLLSKYKREMPDSPSLILFIRPGGIGDAVLLLPAIGALKEKFPDSKIDVLCEKRNFQAFALSNNINRLYLYDRGLELLKCLKNKYDVVIDTEQWHRLSAVVAYLTGAAIRIGFSTNERKLLFTHAIDYSHDEYEVQSFLRLIEPLTGDASHTIKDMPFIDVIDGFPVHLLAASIMEDNKIVAIFPGASVAQRRWGGQRFGAVASALIDRGYKVVILGSTADRADANMIKELASNCIDLTGMTNLMDVASILKNCRLLITADSGLMHIAYAAGTPTVSLFGSGIQKKWAPRGDKHIVLNKHTDCSPCTRFGYTQKCKNGIECLKQITPQEVIKKAIMLLERNKI